MATVAMAQSESEPNDSKTAADAFLMPAASTSGVIVGSSTTATGAGLDYFRVSVPSRATPGFYRHRLIATSTTPGHTLTIRGLRQFVGFIDPASDVVVQTGSPDTTPQRFVQWYTSESGGDIYVMVAGAAATTGNYSLDYEITPVAIVAGPTIPIGGLDIRTTFQTSADTDLWIYDSNRVAIPNFGNDDKTGSSQSSLIRIFAEGTYFLAVSEYNVANNLLSPSEDGYREGNVLDFPGVLAQSTENVGVNVQTVFDIPFLPLTKSAPYEIKFARFVVAETPRFLNGFEN